MTNEELKQKAKEYAEEYTDKYNIMKYNIMNKALSPKSPKHIVLEGFIAGYNKANEWHNLRKNPNDLPKEKVDVYVLYAWGEVDVMHLEWNKEWFDDYGTHCSLTHVTHWKEIVLPEEIKENE